MAKHCKLLRKLLTVFTLTTAIGITGCGKGPLQTFSVDATLKYVGTEDTIPEARVELRQQEARKKDERAVVSGVVQENGTITLTTFQEGDGAPAGPYQIMLKEPPIPLDWDVDTHGDLPPAQIPEKYKSYRTSDLTVEITPGGENRLDIQIEKPRR